MTRASNAPGRVLHYHSEGEICDACATETVYEDIALAGVNTT